jgi:hypothetical protein
MRVVVSFIAPLNSDRFAEGTQTCPCVAKLTRLKFKGDEQLGLNLLIRIGLNVDQGNG